MQVAKSEPHDDNVLDIDDDSDDEVIRRAKVRIHGFATIDSEPLSTETPNPLETSLVYNSHHHTGRNR